MPTGPDKILALFDLDRTLLSRVKHPVAANADPVLAEHARSKGWPMLRIA
jgi:phosphoserine phosphatase